MRIRLLMPSDLAWAMQLKAQAGWNQVDADWRRAMALEPAGCFVAEHEGQPAGTTTVCRFGPVAWIAMVLVDRSMRRKGIGGALLEHALSYCEQVGAHSVRLDATESGRPLYEKLGFVAQFALARYAGTPALTSGGELCTTAAVQDLPRLVALDREITAADRTNLLAHLLAANPNGARILAANGRLLGYALTRPGSAAFQIGPCLATGAAGAALLIDACNRLAGQPVLVDVPVDNHQASSVAERLGLRMERRFLRMTRGDLAQEQVDRLWASSGPETG